MGSLFRQAIWRRAQDDVVGPGVDKQSGGEAEGEEEEEEEDPKPLLHPETCKDGRTDGRTDGRRRRRRDGGVRNGIHSMPASPKPSLIVKYNEEQQTSNICECTALQCSRWNQIALNQLATRS